MRRLTFTALALTVCSTISAASAQHNTGAGLGTLLFEGKDGLVSQVSAVTTNGISSNQTFAITSGTSGADKPASWWARRDQIERFIAGNMDSLATDIAAGQGETLDTVAELLEIPAAQRSSFAASVQARFAEVYPDASVTSQHVTDALIDIAAI